jgi:alkylhydroperoxidase family enzyme
MMASIPYRSTENYEPKAVLDAIIARRGAGGLMNLDRMLLHSPPLAEGWNLMLGRVRRELTLDAKLRELAICTVAVLNGAIYELHHHRPLWMEAGGTVAQAAALAALQAEALDLKEFDAGERAVILLAIEMTRRVAVPPEVLTAARAAVGSDRTLIELIGVIAAYNMVSRFLVATGVEIEGTELRS